MAVRVMESADTAPAEPPEVCSADPVVARLDALLVEFGRVARDAAPVADADRIDRIARLERLRAATAGLQVAESVRFAQSQVAQQMAADVHPERIGRGIADQLALACAVSPWVGSRRLGVARALWFDLPCTYAALLAGELSETVAEIVVGETRHLDAGLRRRVDAEVAAAGIAGLGVKEAAACIRRHAIAADPKGYVQRGRTARKHRRVGLRPAPDTMGVLTGYLPVEQAVACYAALKRHTDRRLADGDERTRDQIMADTLVEWVTGQGHAEDLDIEVQITIPLDALLDSDDLDPDDLDPDDLDLDEPEFGEPATDATSADNSRHEHPSTGSGNSGRGRRRSAQLAGYGPLPVGLVRDILDGTGARLWWRRLFTGPDGQLVGGDPTRRRFDGWLAKLIGLRDQYCRDPFCSAPIRHLDHIHRWSDGGPTTFANGRGTCARGNLIREMPGWQVTLIHAGQFSKPHTVRVTTPTGHSYFSRAPDPP